MFRLGFRLEQVGTEALSWRDLRLILVYSPQGSAFKKSLLGDEAIWGVQEHLLAALVDAVRVGNWQRAGDKNAPRPKPIPRPGVEDDSQRYGSKPIPISEFNEWWQEGV